MAVQVLLGCMCSNGGGGGEGALLILQIIFQDAVSMCS